ncbi:hypothetical protein PG997_004698 [Apiospora hydei]|uniref:Uncharacterized protein n=1 Tax=Apiospora hydei TaxID=1337664 RepID=A0ABR1X2V0_9PEZI
MSPPTMTFGTSATPTKKPLNGFFTKGQWHLRRKTKNEGRWFYTCQKDRSKGAPGAPEHCGFFLFAEDARLREEGALFDNSNAEPSATQTPNKRMKQTTLSAAVTPRAQSEKRVGSTPITSVAELGRQVGVPVAGVGSSAAAPSSSSATMRASDKSDGAAAQVETDSELEDSSDDEQPSHAAPSTAAAAAAARGQTQPATRASAKRKRPADESEDEYFGDWSSDEERQAALITDSTSTRGTDGHGRKRDAFATPATSRTLQDTTTGLATPSLTDKPTRRVLFAEPEIQSTTTKRQRTDEGGSFTRPAATTPSSSQESATTPGSHAGALNVTETVMGLLKGQSLSDDVRGEVRLALQKFEARAKGARTGSRRLAPGGQETRGAHREAAGAHRGPREQAEDRCGVKAEDAVGDDEVVFRGLKARPSRS